MALGIGNAIPLAGRRGTDHVTRYGDERRRTDRDIRTGLKRKSRLHPKRGARNMRALPRVNELFDMYRSIEKS